MEIEIFTLCDFAQDNAGKLTIVGTFDHIQPPVFPWIHPTCSIVGRIRFSDIESGLHNLKFLITNFKNEEIITPIEAEIQIKNQTSENYTSYNFVININQLNFKTEGKYSIQLYIDTEWKSGLTLSLLKK